MSKHKHQVLLRKDDWRIRRDDGVYGYRLERLDTNAIWGDDISLCVSLPLCQTDVKRLFNEEGLYWRDE